MPTEILMPALSPTMEEGTLANFLKTFAKYPIVGRLAVRGG